MEFDQGFALGSGSDLERVLGSGVGVVVVGQVGKIPVVVEAVLAERDSCLK